MAKFPRDNHFSNVYLKKSFNWQIPKLLDNLDKEHQKLETQKNKLQKRLDSILKNYIEIRKPYSKKIQELFMKYKRNLNALHPDSKKIIHREQIIKIRKKICEACKNNSRHIETAHIVKKDQFKGVNKKYDEFRNHRANILLLCHDDHIDLDRENMKQGKLNNLLRAMRKRNIQIMRELNSDSRLTEDFRNKLEKIDNDLKNGVIRTLNQTFRKIS